MHKYVIEKTVTTKCETNTVEGIQGKIAKAMMCSDTSKRFSIDDEGLKCINCSLVINANAERKELCV